MKFQTTEWTLSLHYAGEALKNIGEAKCAQRCNEMLAWILRNIAAVEAIDGKEPHGRLHDNLLPDADKQAAERGNRLCQDCMKEYDMRFAWCPHCRRSGQRRSRT